MEASDPRAPGTVILSATIFRLFASPTVCTASAYASLWVAEGRPLDASNAVLLLMLGVTMNYPPSATILVGTLLFTAVFAIRRLHLLWLLFPAVLPWPIVHFWMY